VIKALKISLDKSQIKDEGDRKGLATWLKSYDKLLSYYNVEPVTWEALEEDDKFVFIAWIPPDCLPEFEEAAEFISETYRDYEARRLDL